jgi:hypothetical protein
MFTAQAVLAFMTAAMQFANTVAQKIPPEEFAEFWKRHDARMERWQNRLDKLTND